MIEVNLAEEDLERLDPLISDLEHEISSPKTVLDGHLDLWEMGGGDLAEASESQVEELGEFVDTTEYVMSYLDLMGTLPHEEVRSMQEYAERSDLPEEMDRQVHRISSVTRDVLNYQERMIDGDLGDPISLSRLMEPLEQCAEGIGVDTDFDYNGLEWEEPGIDSGMRLVLWTLGKNVEGHAYGEVEDLEVGFDVHETRDSYRVDVWDTGPGLFDEFPGTDGKSAEARYRKAYSLFNSEDLGGHGLGMAAGISEVYDADIFYNEEILDDEGFGVTVEVPKY